MNDGLIEVRVTVSQAGARLGQIRLVDPESAVIQARLRLGYLVRLSPEAEIPAEIEQHENGAA